MKRWATLIRRSQTAMHLEQYPTLQSGNDPNPCCDAKRKGKAVHLRLILHRKTTKGGVSKDLCVRVTKEGVQVNQGVSPNRHRPERYLWIDD